ncbi:MAG: alpha/beta hydrolase, partial [Desulfobacterales bacterium]
MNMNHASTFTVPFGTCSLVGDILSNDSPPDVVVLHGAGRSGRHRFYSIRAKLLEHGISSLAFDMVGHGDTGGTLAESSLKDRTLQAESVIKHWKLSEPLSLVGASMSGYTAVSLTQHFNVENLILFVPAMYSRRAYSLCFNDGFSKVIREQNSWFDSDAWDILN